MPLNTTKLTATINQCFDFSMELRLSQTVRAQFLAKGESLREQLLALLTAKFDEGTPALVAANAQLDAVNQQLANAAAVLQNAVDVLNNIDTLITSLDSLAGAAIDFL